MVTGFVRCLGYARRSGRNSLSIPSVNWLSQPVNTLCKLVVSLILALLDTPVSHISSREVFEPRSSPMLLDDA